MSNGSSGGQTNCGASLSDRLASAAAQGSQPAFRPITSITFTGSTVCMASVSAPVSAATEARNLAALPNPGQWWVQGRSLSMVLGTTTMRMATRARRAAQETRCAVSAESLPPM